jgi:intergrase/recombinase
MTRISKNGFWENTILILQTVYIVIISGTSTFSLVQILEDEIIYIRVNPICDQSFGCQCKKLHVANCTNGLSVITINWIRGNKKALATIIPTNYWNKLRIMPKFDQYDIQAAHKILKREAGIAYVILRKIHYNVMRFKNAIELDEAEVLAGRFKSISARHYVLNDPEKLSGKYISAWQNFGLNISENI